MSEFRVFSIGFMVGLFALMLVRRLVGDHSTMTLDELARVAFLVVIIGFAAVAIFGRKSA